MQRHHILKNLISRPISDVECTQISTKNSERAGFPNVVRALDGTYIPISGPTTFRDSYICRKGFPAIHLQAVCDSSLRFLDVFCGYPGSVFRISPFHDALQNLPGKIRKLKFLDMRKVEAIPGVIVTCVLHNFILMDESFDEDMVEFERDENVNKSGSETSEISERSAENISESDASATNATTAEDCCNIDEDSVGISEKQDSVVNKWSNEAVMCLITLKKEHSGIFSSNLTTQKQAWQKVSEMMCLEGHNFTGEEWDRKFRSLKMRQVAHVL
uniref:DDE Tnp4 domain-containing protein n=1 Tax=Magallana gigas TaxID=29159 RepID=A0A8W8NV98_MAGGI